MHFSKITMKKMEIKGIDFVPITLHVELGTFNEIMVEDLSKHKMESEEIFIPEKSAKIINNSKKLNKKYVQLVQL